MKSLILLTLLATNVFANLDNSLQAYRVEILHPRGFKAIVYFTPQYRRIYIHANINKNVSYYETSQYIEALKQQGSGPWIYQNTDVILSPGDTISFYFVEILADGTAHRDSMHYYSITKETPRSYYQSPNEGPFSSVSNGHLIVQTVDAQTSKYQGASQKTDYVYSKDDTEVKSEKVAVEGVSRYTTTGNSEGEAEEGTNKTVHVYSASQTQVEVQNTGQRDVIREY